MLSGEIIDIYCEIHKKLMTRKVMSIQRDTKARSLNHNFSGKVIHITCSECVSIALLSSMQSAFAVLYCHLWPVRQYHIFSHYNINNTNFNTLLTVHLNIFIY